MTKPTHKREPVYNLRDYDLTVTVDRGGIEGRLDLVGSPANGEPAIHMMSAETGLTRNDDGSYTTSSTDTDVMISADAAFTLQAARTIGSVIKAAFSVNSDLAGSVRRHLPIAIGSLKTVDELLSNMINDLPEVSSDGSMDAVIRAELLSLSQLFAALADGREPVRRTAPAETNKAGRRMSSRMLARVKTTIGDMVSLGKDNGLTVADLVGVVQEHFVDFGTIGVQQSVDVPTDVPTVVKNFEMIRVLHENQKAIKKRLKSVPDDLNQVVEKSLANALQMLPGSGTPPDDLATHVKHVEGFEDRYISTTTPYLVEDENTSD